MNQITVLFSQPWIDRLGWTLVHFIWQGAAIALALAVARTWMTSARTRHTAACLVLLSMVIAPAITFLMLGTDGPEPASIGSTAAPRIDGGSYGPMIAPGPAILPWFVATWLAGIAVLSTRLAVGWISAARLHFSGTRPAPAPWQTALDQLVQRMGISRRPQLVMSSHVDVPSVFGWLRPIVLVPVGALSGLSPEYVEALLAHEVAHIYRNDYLINLLQSVVETVLFYHPAVWWVSAQIRTEREHCCDDLAIAATADVLTYARALAELETARRSRVRMALAADNGSLLHRIARLLDPTTVRHNFPQASIGWTLSALLAVGIGVPAIRTVVHAQTYPTVSLSSVWIDTVKQGDLHVQVRGLGKLVSPNLAELKIAETQAKEIRPGLPVKIDVRGAQLLDGRVTNIRPQAQNGTITVDVATSGVLPTTGRPPLEIDGSIAIKTVPNVVYVGRPVFGRAESEGILYRLEPGGAQAAPVKVQFGAASINTIEIRSGLRPGDKIILSDLSAFAGAERINLK
jgi:beta-lactamase regulating signal transducer with metallopeptidase domain